MGIFETSIKRLADFGNEHREDEDNSLWYMATDMVQLALNQRGEITDLKQQLQQAKLHNDALLRDLNNAQVNLDDAVKMIQRMQDTAAAAAAQAMLDALPTMPERSGEGDGE